MKDSRPRISVVLPVYNEAGNLEPLFERLSASLSGTRGGYELIAVDDGSKDGSGEMLKTIARRDHHVTALEFQRNFGQTAALAAGIDAAQGDIIVTIDSDLENDPADIARLVAKLEEGHVVVSGWRRGRWKNEFLVRKLPSAVANSLISYFTGVHLNDHGCTLKAYRADAVKKVRLYGDMHRFLAAYVVWQGGTIAELEVAHAPRTYGKSKYGIGRTFRVVLDLVLLAFMRKFLNRPMHFFGGWGLASIALGMLAGFAAIVLRLVWGVHIIQTPLPTLSALLLILGVEFVLFGIIADMLMRTYYESQSLRPYTVASTTHVEK